MANVYTEGGKYTRQRLKTKLQKLYKHVSKIKELQKQYDVVILKLDKEKEYTRQKLNALEDEKTKLQKSYRYVWKRLNVSGDIEKELQKQYDVLILKLDKEDTRQRLNALEDEKTKLQKLYDVVILKSDKKKEKVAALQKADHENNRLERLLQATELANEKEKAIHNDLIEKIENEKRKLAEDLEEKSKKNKVLTNTLSAKNRENNTLKNKLQVAELANEKEKAIHNDLIEKI